MEDEFLDIVMDESHHYNHHNQNENHNRTIIHIDIDCFYAQVEEIRNPILRTKPLGIQQKNIIVTSNYVARQFGVNKLMLLSDALKKCPNLVLVKGEDLTNYRRMSSEIFNVLHKFTSNVEKLGFDENWLDVSQIIDKRIIEYQTGAGNNNVSSSSPLSISKHHEGTSLEDVTVTTSDKLEGFLFPEDESLESCNCGCKERLIIGSQLAKEIRDELFKQLNITSCAGVAHNKMLSKLAGAQNKPNKQTIFCPSAAERAMRLIDSLRQIPGIGEKTQVLLNEINIFSITDLQNIELKKLRHKFGIEMANKLKDWCTGRDLSIVKPSGKPKSISLEDSCRSISIRYEAEEKFRLLLIRLIEQVTEDGRIPIVIKIILRKYDGIKKSSHREMKQANIVPTLFRHTGDGKIILIEGGQEKLLKIIMRLFERSVDLKKPFNITLLGLAFSKFQEHKKGPRQSIANFLMKKSDVEVQSVTCFSSDGYSPNSSGLTNSSSLSNTTLSSSTSSSLTTVTTTATTTSATTSSSDIYLPRYVTSSPMHMDFESISDTSHASCSSDVSESEIEPSPKKTRIGYFMAKRRFSPNESFDDVSSPSKLRVGDLRLNSRELEREQFNNLVVNTSPISTSSSPSFQTKKHHRTSTLATINNSTHHHHHQISSPPSSASSSKHLLVASIFSGNTAITPPPPTNASSLSISSSSSSSMLSLSSPIPPAKPQSSSSHINIDDISITSITTNSNDLSAILPPDCPDSVDPNVFKELPIDVQQELINQWRGSPSSAVTFPNTTTNNTSTSIIAASKFLANKTISTPQTTTMVALTTTTSPSNNNNNINNNNNNNNNNSQQQKQSNTNNTLHRYFITNK